MQRAVGLSPLTVVLALLIGAAVGGIVGAVLAIPIASVIQATAGDLVQTPTIPTRSSEASGEPSASSPAERAA